MEFQSVVVLFYGNEPRSIYGLTQMEQAVIAAKSYRDREFENVQLKMIDTPEKAKWIYDRILKKANEFPVINSGHLIIRDQMKEDCARLCQLTGRTY